MYKRMLRSVLVATLSAGLVLGVVGSLDLGWHPPKVKSSVTAAPSDLGWNMASEGDSAAPPDLGWYTASEGGAA